MGTTIIKRKVNYMDEQSINGDNNNGKIYGIYYYEVANEDLDTDDQFNSDIIDAEWHESEAERDKAFLIDDLKDLIDIYRDLNNTIVDIYPNMYDWNYYDIEGYYNEMYDEVEFTEDDYSHLANRIIALRNLIKATEELDVYETKYA
jgi:hypothetical protein